MGRELKRVPLDFNWPIGKVWEGYINPHYKPCPQDGVTCFGGSTGGAKWLESIAHMLLVAGGDAQYADNPTEVQKRGRTWPHPYLQEFSMRPGYRTVNGRYAEVPITADLMALSTGLAGRPPSGGFGHDAIDRWTAFRAIKDAAKLPKRWGQCPVCKGHAIDPAARSVYTRWRRKEPPKGKGFQLWSTTSDPEPSSPVFKTLRELAEWCAPNATTFGSNTATADEWEKMLGGGMVAHREGNNVFL